MKKIYYLLLLIPFLGNAQSVEVKYYSNNYIVNPELEKILDNQAKINFTKDHFSYTLINNGEKSIYKNDSIKKIEVDANEKMIDTIKKNYGPIEIFTKTSEPFDYSRKEALFYKDFKKNEIQYHFNLYEKVSVKDSFMDWNWQLVEGTEEILGYTCKKATTNKFGAQITVSYTEELPFSDGPTFYQGLPGLILKFSTKTHETYAYKVTLFNEKIKLEKPVFENKTYTIKELEAAIDEINKKNSLEAEKKKLENQKKGSYFESRTIKNE